MEEEEEEETMMMSDDGSGEKRREEEKERNKHEVIIRLGRLKYYTQRCADVSETLFKQEHRQEQGPLFFWTPVLATIRLDRVLWRRRSGGRINTKGGGVFRRLLGPTDRPWMHTHTH